jgi:ubiquinone biosynthesis O-methyltransferase
MDTNLFGGERLDSKSQLAKNNLLEHLVRYNYIKSDPSGKILDIGCGSGHGSAHLADKFLKVIGVDISEEALEYAKNNWQRDNVSFVVGDALSIPFEDNTFDAIAAFEVFEHLTDWEKFLTELRRVLKPNGIVYISTPNKTLYSPGTTKPINPHHVFEMTIPEFTAAVEKYFVLDTLYGQRTPVYNDHWIWRIVNPILFTGKHVIPYKWNNTLKLRIINWIKPQLEQEDIILSSDPDWVQRSRFVMAVCKNIK